MNVPIGVIQWTEGLSGPELVEAVKRLEKLGYHELWLPEIAGRDPFATAGYLLANTTKIKVSTGIANVYAHDADSAAQAARTLAELSGGRFTLGLGVSHPVLVEPRGHQWVAPVTKMNTYLDRMKEATLMSPAPAQRASVVVAGHGPGLQEVVSNKADGLFLIMHTVETVRRARTIIGPSKELHVAVRVVLDGNAKSAYELAQRSCAFYTSLAPYHKIWANEGFDESDWGEEPSTRLLEAICVCGDVATIKEKLHGYIDAGATHLVLYPGNPDEEYARDSAMSLHWHWELFESMAPAV
jgi:probable F420-dependent oxidoreductase